MRRLLLTLAILMPVLPAATSATAHAASAPNNARIWYTRGGSKIYSMNPDGSDKQLKFSTGDSSLFDMTFSPDGSRIVFVLDHNIYVRRMGTTTSVRLTSNTGQYTDNYRPVISPDGKNIVWTRDDGTLSVWTMKLDGSAKKKVSTGSLDAMAAQWSRSGKYLYWTQINDDSTRSLIRAYSSDGSHASTIMRTTNAGAYVIAGPARYDGQRMLYVSNDADGNYHLYSMNPDGSNKTLRVGGAQNIGFNGSFHSDPEGFGYSPDGKKMFYSRASDSGPNQIWIANADGSNQKQLTFNEDYNSSSPAWRND